MMKSKKYFSINNIATILMYSSIFGLYTGGYIGIFNTATNILLIMFFLASLAMSYQKKIKSFTPVLILFFFTIISTFSVIYSVNSNLSFTRVITLYQLLILSIGISLYYNCNKKNIYHTHRAFGYGGIAYVLTVIILENPFSGTRIGASLGDLNTFGIYLNISLTYFIYGIYITKRKILIIPLLLVLFGILFTGSRTAILSCLIMVLVFVMFAKRLTLKYLIKSLILLSIIGYTLYYVVTINPILNEIIIVRFEKALSATFGFGNQTADNSSLSRIFFIQQGWELFKTRPLLGTGVNTFRNQIIGYYGDVAAAHNNYIDILVGLGILGFILYYSMHVIIIVKMIKYMIQNGKRSAEIGMLLGLLSLALVSDFFLVKYYLKLELFLLLFIYYYFEFIIKSKNRYIEVVK